jgi:uncharacterized membrane protein HdeD (DUF308 family)
LNSSSSASAASVPSALAKALRLAPLEVDLAGVGEVVLLALGRFVIRPDARKKPANPLPEAHTRMLGVPWMKRSAICESARFDPVDVGPTVAYTRSDVNLREAPMSSVAAAQRTLGRVLPPWWLLLITGIGWMLVAVIVLRFDYTSVSAISILFGIVAIAAGVLEIGVLILAQGWWKLLHALLVVVFIAAGIVAFIHPGNTFRALAAVVSFFLIFAGAFDIIVSISARREIEVWWLQLVGGIVELALGFWAAGYYGRSAVLLIAWVSAIAIIRGVRDIVLAFRVREVQHAPAG